MVQTSLLETTYWYNAEESRATAAVSSAIRIIFRSPRRRGYQSALSAA
jgi:hypothetical protein